MSDYSSRIPVIVLTGFLGSGKTTLLQRLLADPEVSDTAVLVNEIGEIGLDHQLVATAAETALVLENGCVCCAMRGDLKDALRDLLSQRQRGAIPAFRRVVIETSGLADPVPVAYTVLVEPVLQHHFRLGSVVTVIDAVNGEAQLDRFVESVKQAAIADRLVLTKTDLAEPGCVAGLEQALRQRNGAAPIVDAADASSILLTDDLYTEEGKRRAVAAMPEAVHHAHSTGVGSFCITFDHPLDWTAFGLWLSMLLNRHGERVLRVKGLLNVAGHPDPVLVNGVQHIVHPPEHLAGWPDSDRRSRLIFIGENLDTEALTASLGMFNALVNRSAEAA